MNYHKKSSRREFLGEASCAAVSSIPLLSTLLNLRLAGDISAAEQPASGEYRALVCLFLSGGNDSFNMLVPREHAAYQEYRSSRANLALPPEQLIEIQPLNTGRFGVHHRMPELAALFEAGNAAFVANVGTLIEPVANRTQVNDNLKRLPLGLYSHSDQLEQWQTSVPHSRSGVGWAGRMADLLKDLNASQTVPMNISLSGGNVWQTGNTVAEYSITADGAAELTAYDPLFRSSEASRLRQVMSAGIDNQLAMTYSNLLQQTFVARKRAAVDAYSIFAEAVKSPLPEGIVFPNDSVGRSLGMVARAIQGRSAIGAVRQTFFVEITGWDHHGELLTNQEGMLLEVSAGVGKFYEFLATLNLQNQVTLFTASDFGRSLTSNGRGSDHAWGGNQFVVGGGVKGRRIFGAYPSLAVNPENGAEINPLDTGRGRMIPTTSVDAFFAELALWLGVSKSNLTRVFPNIGNFYASSSPGPPIGFLI